jgi:hypothetical protein
VLLVNVTVAVGAKICVPQECDVFAVRTLELPGICAKVHRSLCDLGIGTDYLDGKLQRLLMVPFDLFEQPPMTLISETSRAVGRVVVDTVPGAVIHGNRPCSRRD